MTSIYRRIAQLKHRLLVRGEAVDPTAPSCVEDLLSSEALFLITCGRSGSKSLVDFCSRYTRMICVHAPAPWIASVGYLYHQGQISSDGAKYGFYATREPYLIDAYRRNRIFFDGDCKNLPIAAEIGELMPNAKFLHLVRRPEYFIRSGLARGYFKTIPHELWGHLTNSRFEIDPTLSLREQVERIGYFWNEANRIAIAARSKLGPDRVVTLVAESMFADPKRIIESLALLDLADVILESRDYSIRKLNVQKSGKIISNELNLAIEDVVRRICTTKSLYYE